MNTVKNIQKEDINREFITFGGGMIVGDQRDYIYVVNNYLYASYNKFRDNEVDTLNDKIKKFMSQYHLPTITFKPEHLSLNKQHAFSFTLLQIPWSHKDVDDSGIRFNNSKEVDAFIVRNIKCGIGIFDDNIQLTRLLIRNNIYLNIYHKRDNVEKSYKNVFGKIFKKKLTEKLCSFQMPNVKLVSVVKAENGALFISSVEINKYGIGPFIKSPQLPPASRHQPSNLTDIIIDKPFCFSITIDQQIISEGFIEKI